MQQPRNYLNCISKLATISLIYKVAIVLHTQAIWRAWHLLMLRLWAWLRWNNDKHLASYMIWLHKTAKAVAVQTTWTHRAILLLFLMLPWFFEQWFFSKYIDMICSHRPRHRHHKTSLLMHVILGKIRVGPGYFIKQVRPSWPGQNVNQLIRMIWMTRPSCNAGIHQYTQIYIGIHQFILVYTSILLYTWV